MRFLMDEVHDNTILGFFNGTLEGGASLVTGVRGRALYIDGQQGSHVAYGTYTDGCLFDPDQCNQGITISFWLYLQEMSAVEIFFNNGGCSEEFLSVVGYCFYYDSGSIVFEINTRGGFYMYIYDHLKPILNVWNSFIFTYISGNIKVFVNGCNGEPHSSIYNGRYSTISPADSSFYIGNLPHGGKAHVTIDELMVWYRVLREEEMWDLYIQDM